MRYPQHFRRAPRKWLELYFDMAGWLSVIFIAGVVGMTVWSVVLHRDAHRLEVEGAWAAATIVDRRVSVQTKGSDDYYATFRYEVGSDLFRAERNVGRSFYNLYGVGWSVDIKYWTQDPRKFEFIENQTKKSAWWRQGIALGIGIMGLLVFWKVGGRTNSAVLARKNGLLTTATIQSVVERKGQYGGRTGKGTMTFLTEDGLSGESLEGNIGDLIDLGEGTEISVFVRGDDVWWEGDVGPRRSVPSQFPKVPLPPSE